MVLVRAAFPPAEASGSQSRAEYGGRLRWDELRYQDGPIVLWVGVQQPPQLPPRPPFHCVSDVRPSRHETGMLDTAGSPVPPL